MSGASRSTSMNRKMKENYLITIDGVIEYPEDTETISLTTVGSYYTKGDKRYICYRESESTGFEGCLTTVKAWEDGVSITRFGSNDFKTNLTIQKGAVNLCNYETFMGSMMLDIDGVDVENRLNDEGGDLSFSYSLNAGGILISDNKVKVNIKEIN